MVFFVNVFFRTGFSMDERRRREINQVFTVQNKDILRYCAVAKWLTHRPLTPAFIRSIRICAAI